MNSTHRGRPSPWLPHGDRHQGAMRAIRHDLLAVEG